MSSQLGPVIEAVCGQALKPRHATYLAFADGAGQPIDHGLALHFPAPHSYTGEDVLELQAHGGPVVLQLLLARCLEAAGDRPQDGGVRRSGLGALQRLGRSLMLPIAALLFVAILAFTLHRLGKEDVALYDGSWSEWGADPGTPKETGPAD